MRNRFYTFKNVIAADTGATFTNVDVELAEILRRRIAETYPEHGIVIQGEAKNSSNREYCWYIDPLDGSGHFLRNIPVYTVNIAVRHNGETILAAVNHPQTHQLFFAEQGAGAFLNGLKIHVSAQHTLADAFVFLELPEKKFTAQLSGQTFAERMSIVQKLAENVRQLETFRIGAFGQCLVASGAFDAYVDLSGSSQAVSQFASALIVREAGGEIVHIAKPQNGFVQTMMANAALMPMLQKLLTVR
ncbi:hypothetical protein A2477_03180 [Candidatus Falkowbacteria bacterium RIFOXYC2_FULL_47_12]|uniref:Inositol-phosphate phosphatase n=2 Tax=Candidatus Falkowiibacteriota TaxID=1752728 RepID=A0A1F5TQP2_9BACT|nr:MAG: hypothetical protein A2242_01875 [Candidatus Falkowbacteria bacterium RIFOXYA2_FULL_47_9]OGF41332.1 MAG: hypothetical protein A2477_03180 [Candidatus Falkowbacteria bacterium RIFOXYC2_FULL_47_12]